MHNLSTVIRFEVVRMLKKKSFWLASLSFPLIIGLLSALMVFSSAATQEAAEEAANEKFTIAMVDDSGLVSPEVAQQLSVKTLEDKQQGVERVKNGSLDAFYYYPSNVAEQSVEVYGRDVGIFDNGRYGAVAKSLLEQSIKGSLDPSVVAIVSGNVRQNNVVYRDGVVYNPIQEAIVPGLFLVLFYLLIVTFGGQMLVSTTEEKENRVIEMILTTVKAQTLIVGKIISLVLLGAIQMLVVVIPVVIGYLLYGDRLAIPDIDLASLPFDAGRIALGLLIFVVSFMLFTGLLVTIGAATPTAREANGYFGAIIMFLFGPLYATPLFVSAPESLLVQGLSYFPLTAPVPLLLRNAVGNLSSGEALIACAILLVTAAFVVRLAVNVFKTGVLEYNRTLKVKEIFGK